MKVLILKESEKKIGSSGQMDYEDRQGRRIPPATGDFQRGCVAVHGSRNKNISKQRRLSYAFSARSIVVHYSGSKNKKYLKLR
jgi:hypothetical protein